VYIYGGGLILAFQSTFYLIHFLAAKQPEEVNFRRPGESKEWLKDWMSTAVEIFARNKQDKDEQ
jgi:hypothetical protein